METQCIMERTKSQNTMVKRRKACQNCHDRKVRCVVESSTSVCNNCIQDGVDCYLAKSRRGMKPRKQPAQRRSRHGQTYTSGIHGAEHTASWLSPYQTAHDEQASWCKRPICLNTSNPKACLRDSTSVHLQPARCLAPSAEDTLHQEISYTSLIQRQALRFSYVEKPSWKSDFLPSPPSTDGSGSHVPISRLELPTFLSPLPLDLDWQDVCFLNQKGAFEIADLALRSALMRGYIESLHPWMPFVDLELVYGSLQAHPGPNTPKISILLFQALMFAGCASGDIAELHRAGFSSRREARKVYFERVKLLYDFNVEKDRRVVLQAVLLMSLWSNSADDEKGCWHWMGVALTLALGLGLHRKDEMHSASAKEHRQRRRLWWSCYIRDRTFVQAMSRPSRIRPEDFDTPMLSCVDFDFIDPSSVLSDEESKYVPVGNTDNQRQLAEVCVKLAELSVHIGEVIELHFSMVPSMPRVKPVHTRGPTSSPMLYPRSNPRDDAVWTLDKKLQSWFQNLPRSCLYRPSQLCATVSASVVLSRGYLCIAYFSLLSALHRPQCFTTSSECNEGRRILSRDRVRSAANQVTSITRDLNRIGLLVRGPQPIVMFQLPAILSHVQHLGYSVAEGDGRAKIIHQLFHTIQAVEVLQEVNSGADVPASLISHVLSKAQIYVVRDQNKGENKGLVGIRFKGVLYLLDGMSGVSSTPLNQEVLDEGAAANSNVHVNAGTHEYGLSLPNITGGDNGENDWDPSAVDDALFSSLSPFLGDFGNMTTDEDLWFLQEFEASLPPDMDFVTL